MSYRIPDLWPTRNMDAGDVLDSLVLGHDQEWTQLGRHLEAQSDIEARFNGAHLAPRPDEQSASRAFDAKMRLDSKPKIEIMASSLKPQGAATQPQPSTPQERRQQSDKFAVKAMVGSKSCTDLRQEHLETLGLSESESEASSDDDSDQDDFREHLVAAQAMHSKRLSVAAQASYSPTPADEAIGEASDEEGGAKTSDEGAVAVSATVAAAAALGVPFCSPPEEQEQPKTQTQEQTREEAPRLSRTPSPPTAPTRESTATGKPSPPRGQRAGAFNPLSPQWPAFASARAERRAAARTLHSEIEAFLEATRATAASRAQRQRIVDEVRGAATACWEGAQLDVYGSFATDLFLPHSDVDLVISGVGSDAAENRLQRLATQLRSMRWCRHVHAIETASVPVIKLSADVALLQDGALEGADVAKGAEAAAEQDGVLSDETGAGGETEQENHLIAVDVTFHETEAQREGVAYAPLRSRDFVCAEMARFPLIKPLVLVLKHFLFSHELNDAYTGGLSSHSLILLLIFFFQYIEKTAGADDVPEDCRLGEWLLRTMQWLAEFPFDHVGISVGSSGDPEPSEGGERAEDEAGETCLVGLTRLGVSMCEKRQLIKSQPRSESELLIFGPCNPNVNIARSSFRWWLVRQGIQRAFRVLSEHREVAPAQRIFGGVPQSRSPLAAIFAKGDILKSSGSEHRGSAPQREPQLEAPRVKDSITALVGKLPGPGAREGFAETWAAKAAMGRTSAPGEARSL